VRDDYLVDGASVLPCRPSPLSRHDVVSSFSVLRTPGDEGSLVDTLFSDVATVISDAAIQVNQVHGRAPPATSY
jgi:hypothetical protein